MRIGTVCYATEQGISYLPKWFYDAGVITEVMIFRHGSRLTHYEWYPQATIELVRRPFNGEAIDEFLSKIDCMLFFETPFDWSFLDYCRVRKVKTVIVPMYECTPRTLPAKPDKWICPSLLDVEYFPDSPFLQIPVPPDIVWKQRTKALKFLHNGGNLGLRGHKGTREILEAFKLLRKPIELTVRGQDVRGLKQIVSEVFGRSARLNNTSHTYQHETSYGAKLLVEFFSRRYDELFDSHDVFIMAEKYNGLSLPLIEARASGMVVITSNRYPMYTWLPPEYLIPVSHFTRESIGGPYNTYDEAHLDPATIAGCLDEVYGKDISGYSEEGLRWKENNSWSKLKDQWLEELGR